MSFDCTFQTLREKSSLIDITLCSSALIEFCSNWRTDDELDVYSDHLPITFNIRTTWSAPLIERQKIETWNLRSNNREQFRKVLEKKLTIWSSNLPEIMFDYSLTQELDDAVKSWTKCVVEAGDNNHWITNCLQWK